MALSDSNCALGLPAEAAAKHSGLAISSEIKGNVIYELQELPTVGQFDTPLINQYRTGNGCSSLSPTYDHGKTRYSAASLPATYVGAPTVSKVDINDMYTMPIAVKKPHFEYNRCREPRNRCENESFTNFKTLEPQPKTTRKSHTRHEKSSVGKGCEQQISRESRDEKEASLCMQKQDASALDSLERPKRKARHCRVSLDELPKRADIQWHENVPYLICNFPPCKKEVAFDKAPASKRFCSNSCAKRYNVFCSQRMKDYKDRQLAIGKDAYMPSRRRRKRHLSPAASLSSAADDEAALNYNRHQRRRGGSENGDVRQHGRQFNINVASGFVNGPEASSLSMSRSGTPESLNYSMPSVATMPESPAKVYSDRLKRLISSDYDVVSGNNTATRGTLNQDVAIADSSSVPRTFQNLSSREQNLLETGCISTSATADSGRDSNIQPETDIPSSSGGLIFEEGDGSQPNGITYISIDDMIARKPLAWWTKDELALFVRHVIPDDGGSSLIDTTTANNGLTPVEEHSVAQKFLSAQIDGASFMLISRHQQLCEKKCLGILLGHALKLIKKRLELLELDVNKRWIEKHKFIP